MTDPDELDKKLYDELFDYEKAAENASARFDVESPDSTRRILYRSDGRLRYWCYVYIVAIDLFGPDPLDFQRESCQSEILRLCKECGQPQLVELFPEAKQTAWYGTVLMAERALTGKDNPQSLTVEQKLEQLDTGLIALDLNIGGELEKAWDDFRNAVCSDDWDPVEKLGNRNKKGNRPKEDQTLQAAIFSHWVHPDFPLWLMEIKPALRIVNILRELWGIRAPTGREALQMAKKRLSDSGQLVTNLPRRPAVITDVKVRVEGLRQIVESYDYTKKFLLQMPHLPPRQPYA